MAKPLTFGEKLALLIAETGLSVNGFCRQHELSQSSLQSYIAGTTRPTWDMVQKISTALNVSTEVFRDNARGNNDGN